MRLKINDLLGAFMFGGETSEKYVKVLSGGERSRLAMIRLLLSPVNLLILDEPTNHLDIPSKEVLKEAIKAFDGTAIIVSHDREFLDGLVSKVYEFGGGRVREHLGGIYDFLRAHQAETISEVVGERTDKEAAAAVQPVLAETPKAEAPDNKDSWAEHKEKQKKLRKAQRAVEESEAKIAKMEGRLKELDSSSHGSEECFQHGAGHRIYHDQAGPRQGKRPLDGAVGEGRGSWAIAYAPILPMASYLAY